VATGVALDRVIAEGTQALELVIVAVSITTRESIPHLTERI
jgi:hypothetical protein